MPASPSRPRQTYQIARLLGGFDAREQRDVLRTVQLHQKLRLVIGVQWRPRVLR